MWEPIGARVGWWPTPRRQQLGSESSVGITATIVAGRRGTDHAVQRSVASDPGRAAQGWICSPKMMDGETRHVDDRGPWREQWCTRGHFRISRPPPQILHASRYPGLGQPTRTIGIRIDQQKSDGVQDDNLSRPTSAGAPCHRRLRANGRPGGLTQPTAWHNRGLLI